MVGAVPVWRMTSIAFVYRDGLERIVQTVSVQLGHEIYLTDFKALSLFFYRMFTVEIMCLFMLGNSNSHPRLHDESRWISKLKLVRCGIYGVLTRHEDMMAGYWPSSFSVFMDRDGVILSWQDSPVLPAWLANHYALRFDVSFPLTELATLKR